MIVDIGIILALIAITYFISIKQGRKFVITLIFSFYLTILIAKYLLIETAYVEGNVLSFAFLALLVVTYLGVKKYTRNHKPEGGAGKIGSLALSMAASILVLTSYFYYLPENVWAFSDQIRDWFFYSENILGIIFLIPLVAIFISSKDD